MKPVILYTKPFCSYCHRAKALLTRKNVNFEAIDIAGKGDLREEMIQKSNGGATVPQIFIGDTHIGGFDDMAALERTGKLDAILAG